jgi:elongation factor P
VLDRTYKSGESLAEADVEEHTMQYLYSDGTDFHFMNMEDFSQLGIPVEVVGKTSDFLVEEMEVQVLFFKSNPVNIDLPNFVELAIEYTEPGIKGNTSQGATKSATLITGAEVQVPLFLEQGEILKIDTRTRQYVSRVR